MLPMHPLSITLKGFRGIRDGLGLDTLTLDFVLLHRCLHRWTVSARLPRWGKVKYDWLRRTP